MQSPQLGLAGTFIVLALGTTACATRTQPVSAPTPAVAPEVATTVSAPEVPESQPDPVEDLIAQSNAHFAAGERELTLGHLEQARSEFNRSLELLLESSFGARLEPRIRDHFDRLVEKISASEVTALAQGDGFAEQRPDPASIDDLLAIATFEVPPTPETQETVAADLQTTTHDIEIPLNKKVLSFVQLFSGRLRTYLEEGLSRGARYLPMIQSIFRAEGLPLDLAYVPLVESAFKTNAVSRAKAKGMWQFMRGTALENGLRTDWYIDERAEPEKATRAAAKYLKSLYNTFGDWHLALASYNGGPGRVQRAMKRSGRKDFWKLSASSRYLPRETRDYVPLILAAVIIARNPAQYGVAAASGDEPGPMAFETVRLPTAVDLRRIAEWAGTSVETIQGLNPELRRWTTPIRGDDYQLKVPAGSAEQIEEQLATTDLSQMAALNWHTVKKGETLAAIARKLKVSRTDLAEANYRSIRSRVRPGEQLVIPRPPTLLQAARLDNPAPVVAEARPIEGASAVLAVGPVVERSEPTKLIYRVKEGDTLFSIARLFQTTVASLKSWNKLRTNAIRAGDRLTIFTARVIAD